MVSYSHIKKFLRLNGVEKYYLTLTLIVNIITKIMIRVFPLKFYFFLIKADPLFFANEQNIIQRKLDHIDLSLKRLKKACVLTNYCLENSITLKVLLNISGIPSDFIISLKTNQDTQIFAHCYIKVSNKLSYFKDIKFIDMFAF